MVQMSFAAIAMVTKVPEDQARHIISDFFRGLVEVSRRTTKEARIELKGLGFIHLFKNRELSFHPQSDMYSELTLDALNKEREDRRDDLSQIADNASAVLSIGGGSSFNVRSEMLSRMSIQTPSHFSSILGSQKTASRATSKKERLPALNAEKQLWRRYASRDKRNFTSKNSNEPFLTVSKMNDPSRNAVSN